MIYKILTIYLAFLCAIATISAQTHLSIDIGLETGAPILVTNAEVKDLMISASDDADITLLPAIMASHQLTYRLKLIGRLAITERLFSYRVTDLAERCDLCPVRKVGTFGGNYLQFSTGVEFDLLKGERSSLGILIAIIHNISIADNERAFDFKGMQERTAETLNTIGFSFKGYVPGIKVGLKGDFGRFYTLFSANLTPVSLTKDLDVDGGVEFDNQYSTLSISLGYTVF